MFKAYDLPCFDGRKSFYGKARIIECENGCKYLKSYNTIVCMINNNNEFIRLWDGESQTTMRHVNSFLQFFNKSGGGVNFWRQHETQAIKYSLENDLLIQ